MDDCPILFRNRSALPGPPRLQGCAGVFTHQHEPARLAVETIDQLREGPRAQVQTNLADETRINVALGRVTDEIGRFVDDEEIVVFINYLKQSSACHRSPAAYHAWCE